MEFKITPIFVLHVSILIQNSVALFQKGDDVSYRLPGYVIPYEYNLSFEVHEKAKVGKGVVEIKLRTIRNTHEIVLHADSTLIISKSAVEVEGRDEKIKPSLQRNDARQTVTFNLNKRISAGTNMTLTIEFVFTRNDCFGFFSKCAPWNDSIVHPTGETDDPNIYHTVEVASLFSPNHARKAFPCFDEPHFKARFHLTEVRLIHRNAKNMIVLFNTEGIQVSSLNGMSKWIFPEPSPIMSTYILGLVIAHYPNVHTEYFDGRRVTFYHSMQQLNRDEDCKELALNSSLSQYVNLTEPLKQSTKLFVKVILYFEKYFSMKSPLKKIDVVHVPLRYSGMENWGLIALSDTTCIEKDPPKLSCTVWYLVYLTHEALHTWFGNLVTHSSWSHAFIKEGFTHFYTMKYIGMLHPTVLSGESVHQKIRDVNILTDTGKGKSMSSVIAPKDKPNFFPGSVYSKGMMILRMLEGVVGENTFKSASVQFLRKHKYNSADTWEYLDVLQEVINANKVMGWDNEILNVTKFLHVWLTKQTYPDVNIEYDRELSLITISQSSQFSKYKWYIPVFYQVQFKGPISIAWVIPGYRAEFGESNSLPKDPRDIVWDPEVRGWYNISLADELKQRPSPFKSSGTDDVTEEQREILMGYANYINSQQRSVL